MCECSCVEVTRWQVMCKWRQCYTRISGAESMRRSEQLSIILTARKRPKTKKNQHTPAHFIYTLCCRYVHVSGIHSTSERRSEKKTSASAFDCDFCEGAWRKGERKRKRFCAIIGCRCARCLSETVYRCAVYVVYFVSIYASNVPQSDVLRLVPQEFLHITQTLHVPSSILSIHPLSLH